MKDYSDPKVYARLRTLFCSRAIPKGMTKKQHRKLMKEAAHLGSITPATLPELTNTAGLIWLHEFGRG